MYIRTQVKYVTLKSEQAVGVTGIELLPLLVAIIEATSTCSKRVANYVSEISLSQEAYPISTIKKKHSGKV